MATTNMPKNRPNRFSSTRSLLGSALGLGAVAAIDAVSPFAAWRAVRGRKRPDVIVILVDDMGFSDIGPYGSEIPTLHLDALAAGGVNLRDFTTPDRAAARARPCLPVPIPIRQGLVIWGGDEIPKHPEYMDRQS